jgi:hypothetical protein
MSAKGNFYIPTRLVNGVPTKVTTGDWVKETLGADEFAKFQVAESRQQAIFADAIATGKVVRTNLLDSNGETYGETYEFNGPVTDDAEWKSYEDKFRADTSLTVPTDHAVMTSDEPVPAQ